MATRNLTKRFLEIRNGAKANRTLGLNTADHHDDDGGDGVEHPGQGVDVAVGVDLEHEGASSSCPDLGTARAAAGAEVEHRLHRRARRGLGTDRAQRRPRGAHHGAAPGAGRPPRRAGQPARRPGAARRAARAASSRRRTR